MVFIVPILEWLGKNEAVNMVNKVSYKLLKVNEDLSYGEKNENMIIKGDNLEALKALLPYYKGQVKCIYIDPPYNTGSRIDADGNEVGYDDNLEHSIWCSMMYTRLELLKELLANNGCILVQTDKNESSYLKVIMDEVFGRNTYITTLAVRMSGTSGFKIEHADKTIVKNTEYIHLYSNNLSLKPSFEETSYDSHYSYIIKSNEDNELVIKQLINETSVALELKKYQLPKSSKSLSKLFLLSENFKKFVEENKDVIGRTHTAPSEAIEKYAELSKILKTQKHVIIFKSKNGENYYIKKTSNSLNQYIPISLKYQMVDTYDGYSNKLSNILGDWWDGFYLDMGNVENEGNIYFKASKKPERLIFRILNMFTNEGDLVLDSFLGSGTTCAVAHKMRRKYIGIEMANHAVTHCVPRLKFVIDGEQSGISQTAKWNGGGGYTFYDLGEPIFDENGNINEKIDFKTLASHIWFSETKTPLTNYEKSPLLGIHNGVAYYLLFNGILGNKKPDGGNVLTSKILNSLPEINNKNISKKVIFGESCRIGKDKLLQNNIIFKQIPYEVNAR